MSRDHAFYHPILPLLWTTRNLARMSMPRRSACPGRAFRHPEDATAQIRMGIEYFEKLFGFRAQGMWPSEGLRQPRMFSMRSPPRASHGCATDEEMLARSIGWPIEQDPAG
ncbi:MAG: hypothetical protein MZV70_00990 [Desulfobacterales bacterium]|nr:hypothetical protein [Desulfobacterales bacterium]